DSVSASAETSFVSVQAAPAPVTARLPERPAVLAPLSPGRHKVEFTVDDETRDKLELCRDLLRHAVPSGSLNELLRRALELLIAELLKAKFAVTGEPRPARGAASGSRYIPAEVKRAVYLRDLGRCAYVSETGKRCGSRAWLEFHHLIPYAAGGEATVENLALACTLHNKYAAKLWFGPRAPERGGSVREEPAIYGAALPGTCPGADNSGAIPCAAGDAGWRSVPTMPRGRYVAREAESTP